MAGVFGKQEGTVADYLNELFACYRKFKYVIAELLLTVKLPELCGMACPRERLAMIPTSRFLIYLMLSAYTVVFRQPAPDAFQKRLELEK